MRLIQFVFVALASRKDSVLSYSVFPQQLQSFLRVVKPECNVCLITYCTCVCVWVTQLSPHHRTGTDSDVTGSTWTNQITWGGVGVFQSARSDWTWGPLEYKQHNKPTMSVSSQSSDVIKSYIKNNSDYIQTLLLFVLKVVYQVECF